MAASVHAQRHIASRPLKVAAHAYHEKGRTAPAATACATAKGDPAVTFPIFDCQNAAQDPERSVSIYLRYDSTETCLG